MRKTVCVAVVCACVSMTVFCVAQYYMLCLRIQFADEQLLVFSQVRIARSATLDDTVNTLDYVVNYYPSGTKQTRDSPLDRIVERQRSETVQFLIAQLQKLTDDDCGNDPLEWLQKYKSVRKK